MKPKRSAGDFRYHFPAVFMFFISVVAIWAVLREGEMFSNHGRETMEKSAVQIRKSERNAETAASATTRDKAAPLDADAEKKRRDAFSGCINLLLEHPAEELTSKEDRAHLLELLASNPMDAVAWVNSLEPSPRQSGLLLAVSMEWARLDYPAAWNWAKAQPEDGLAAAVLFSSAAGGGEIRKQAEEWFRATRERAEMRQSALIGLVSNNNQWKLAAEIVRLCDPETQENFMRYSLSSAAARDPKQALEIAGSLEDPAMKDSLTKMIFSGWSPEKAGELSEFAFSLPAGDLREFAITMTAVKLLQKDPAELDRWLELHPEQEALRESEPVIYSRKVEGMEMNFMTAMKWANRIPDGERRFKAVEYIATQLAEFSPAKAADYVATTAGNDEQMKSRLMASIKDSGGK